MMAARSRTGRTPKNAREHDAQLVPIASLKPYPGNARTHDLPVIRESLRLNGQYRPLVVRTRTRHVLAGNGTLEAAIEEGWSEIWVTFIDVDARAAKRINLVDNRANDLAGWDEQALALQLGSLPSVEGTGWSERELVSFMAKVNGPGEDTEPSEPPKAPETKPGDLWLLGEHRLLCGDARESLSALAASDYGLDVLVTDPPYGVEFDGKKTKETRRHGGYTTGDDAEVGPLIVTEALRYVKWAGVFPGTRQLFLYPRPADVGCVFCPAGTGLGTWGFTCFHPILYYGKRRSSAFRPTSMQSNAGADNSLDHPCPKPMEWMAWLLNVVSEPGDGVLDPFAGSGSTLIACENLRRRCYAMEIDPGYCDVIVDRWERHTGRKAQRGQ